MHAAPELEADSRFTIDALTGRVAGLLPGLRNVIAWAALIFAGVFTGGAVVVLGLPSMTALAVMLAFGFALGLVIGFRDLPLVGLIVSIPLPIGMALTARPGYIGSADGISIALIDCWMAWLLVQHVCLRRSGQVKAIRHFGVLCLPVAVLLFADVLSFSRSVDLELSLAGLLSDVRVAFLFGVLAVALAQDADAMRAGLTGVLWAVLGIGALCVIEAAVRVNVQPDPQDAWMEAYAFRAGGFNVATNTAGYLAVLLPLVLAEAVRADSPSRRCLAGLAFAIGLAGLACTLTRSAIGFLVLGSLPLVLYLFRNRLLRIRHFLFVVATVGVLVVSLGDRISSRIDEGPENAVARYGLTATALNMAWNSPLTGQGVNTYGLKMREFEEKHPLTSFKYLVHNKYLLTLAETGGLGLLAFVWSMAIVLTRSLACARRSLLGIGLLGSMIVALLHMIMESYAGNFTLWNVWTIAAFVAAMSGSTEDLAPDRPFAGRETIR